jgi:Fe-S-cluster containining protein
MQATNRLSNAQREALARQDAPFLAAGLIPGNPHSFEAHLRHAARLLRDRQTSASPSVRLVRHVTELFERSVPESARARIACASGCSFCCHQPVRVSPAEAFFLARQLSERADTMTGVRAAAALLSGRSADAPRVAWIRCPLLDRSGNCSVYAARPLGCHTHVSVDVNDCKNAYPQPGDAVVREPVLYSDLRNSSRMILQASLRLNGLPDTHYELNAALRIAMDTDNAEKRWLRGENIFAALPEVSPNKPEVERILALMAERVGPTL